ncbi:hypothetical protein VAE151_560358 [Vibrio aestuarianus]|uniref:Uncharacterized protein n=1 Tax=Vibrio aestuarianus TaxID=28171 RepID=A0ABN8TX66_9VIBR|nr:hypothetical protein VAEU17_1360002 [Vibrio aestuarianus]CAH8203804.1 hypothetical protein VIBAE_A31596 [Vibrio aestuarianus subsp. francensis]CAH8204417.1 hypothetical protein VAE055_380355 [Vibrio aestuarianus]CAH8204518.1 hypothetical protein VAE032_270997 [Vibrio aestuarianus]CAH8204633.1 hypothetical protein VAE128_461003 [Vibrio aestuarianus]
MQKRKVRVHQGRYQAANQLWTQERAGVRAQNAGDSVNGDQPTCPCQ